MPEDKNTDYNIFSELTSIAKSLAKRIHEQWAALASLLAILVTIIILTFVNSEDKDGNEYQILLIAIGFFTVILLLGKDRHNSKEPTDLPETEQNQSSDPEIAFKIFCNSLESDSLQYKILDFLNNKGSISLPEISENLNFNTAIIRKSADRLVARGFLKAEGGEKPSHISYKASYKLQKRC